MEISIYEPVDLITTLMKTTINGMTDRIRRLRQESFDTQPSLSIERALIETEFYKENEGKYPIPILRALNFLEICKRKTIYIGEDELIVGERGPHPKAVSTFPELTCHSVEDLHVLNTRELQRYTISQEDIDTYEREVIPYWKGRTQRERIFNHVPKEWKEAYEAGMFTEFMEQRAPGHTSLDGKVYQYGMLDLKERIAHELRNLDFMNDPEATDKQEELTAMSISCDAAIIFAERHAELAEKMAGRETDPKRKKELKKIAEICRWVPAHAPRTYWEAIQMYWFVHLGTITELNGWDAMNPGHFDQHLTPFYENDLKEGILTRAEAKELMSCFFIKINNQTAPPKVGITAKESGTYNDFTNLNIGGIKRDGSNGVSEVSYIMLETVDDLHLLQPGSALHISVCTPERFLREGCKVIRKGYGYPSVFNPDTYVMELMRQGKTPEDIIRDPYVLEFLGLSPNDDFYESDLEQALITHLQKFLLELGRGFSFVARQKRITFDGRHFRIDLVFYNYILKCFVLIDLKVGDLTHQDLGQMQMYVHYYERELMNEGDNPPIGIVLCADKSESVVKYTLPENETQIFASKYKLYLPSEEELLRELNQEYRALEAGKTDEEYIDGMKKE